MKIFETAEEGYKISYKDFTSLYPFTNYQTEYPVGHPTVIYPDETHVHWTSPNDNPYKGLLKVLVIPPRGLAVPVLPVRFDARLLFPLCKKCSLRYPEGGKDDKSVFISLSLCSLLLHHNLIP